MATARTAIPATLGALALATAGPLLLGDAFPRLFPAGSHDVFGAACLVLIAIAYLVHQTVRRPPATELVKAILLATAFLFWGANQFWPALPSATLFNDIAILLFVLDVLLVIVGWPSGPAGGAFAETYVKQEDG